MSLTRVHNLSISLDIEAVSSPSGVTHLTFTRKVAGA
jgi:hypothetical protein